jgi:hypothetical protein
VVAEDGAQMLLTMMAFMLLSASLMRTSMYSFALATASLEPAQEHGCTEKKKNYQKYIFYHVN